MERMRTKMTYADIASVIGYSEKQVRGWINNNCGKKCGSLIRGTSSISTSATKRIGLVLYMLMGGFVSAK